MLFVKHVNELSLSELVSADRTTQHTRILRDFETEANVLAHQAPVCPFLIALGNHPIPKFPFLSHIL